MIVVIVANVIDFVASMLLIYSGTIKNKRGILIAQTTQIGLQAVSMFLLGAITGGINNILSVIRNYACYKEKLTWLVKVIITALSFYLTLKYNTQGALGWVPFAICTVYIIFMNVKDPVKFKILVTLTVAPWIPFYLIIKSYTGAFFCAMTVLTNVVTIYRMVKYGVEIPAAEEAKASCDEDLE